MSIKLDRMDGKRDLAEELSVSNYCGDYDYQDEEISLGERVEARIESWLDSIEEEENFFALEKYPG